MVSVIDLSDGSLAAEATGMVGINSSSVPSAPSTGRLKLNRCLRLNRLGTEHPPKTLEVSAPIAGEGLRISRFDYASHASLCDFLWSLQQPVTSTSLPIPSEWLPQLQAAGVVVAPHQLPQRVRFACPLPALEDTESTKTRRQGWAGKAPNLTWIVHPRVRLLPGNSAYCAPWPANPLIDCSGLAWLEDLSTGLEWGYTLTDEDIDVLRPLITGQVAPAALSSGQRQRYIQAGILLAAESLQPQARAAAWKQAYWQAHLAREGYVRLNRLLPLPLLKALQLYFSALIAQGHLPFNDKQSSRYYGHSEPMSVWLHWQLNRLISKVIATPSKPSYAFLGGYVPGAELPRHTDRPQCEHTLSLTLDAEPDARRRAAWPLCLQDQQGKAQALRLAPGDGLLFKGRELPHWREVLGANRQSRSAFLHFVPATFNHSLK